MLLGAIIGGTMAAALEASASRLGGRALDLGRVGKVGLTGVLVGAAGTALVAPTDEASAPAPAPVARLNATNLSSSYEPSSYLGVDVRSLRPGQEVLLDPGEIRFQARPKTEERRRWAEVLAERVKEEGWDPDPVDVVLTKSGPVTLDDARVAVARELGLKTIPVRVHAPDEKLPPEVAQRLGPRMTTWGDAVLERGAQALAQARAARGKHKQGREAERTPPGNTKTGITRRMVD